MAETIRLEFKDDTPPAPQPNYLTGQIQQPTSAPAPTAATRSDEITPSVYRSYSEFERKLADRLIAEGQLHLVQDVGVTKEQVEGEKEAQALEKRDQQDRAHVRKVIADQAKQATQKLVGPLDMTPAEGEQAARLREVGDKQDRAQVAKLFADQEKEEARRRAQGEKEAKEKEAQDARDRAHVLKHIEDTIPLAEKVEEPQAEVNDPMKHLRPLMQQMGFGGTARLLDKFMGAAGGAGGAAGGADAAIGAGDVGLAIAAAAKVIQTGTDTLRVGMKAHSDTVVELAGNNYMGAFNKQVEGAADTMRQIPIVGGAFASALELTVQPVRSFTDVVQAFVDRGRELSAYSGPLATATARADLRATMSDIQEARQLGPELAQLVDLQSQAWAELREIMLPIKKGILEILIPMMKEIIDLFHLSHEKSGEHQATWNDMALSGAVVNGGLPGIIASLIQANNTLNDIRHQGEKELDPLVDYGDWFKEAFQRGPALPLPPLPNPVLPVL